LKTEGLQGKLRAVSADEFDGFLTSERCWIDGTPTGLSSGAQRQCPLCRRKWSYVRLQKQWELAKHYAIGSKRTVAADVVGVSAHTAGIQYHRFHEVLGSYFLRRLQFGPPKADEPGLALPPELVLEVESRTRHVRRSADRAKIANLCILSAMEPEERLELLYVLIFRKSIWRLSGSPAIGRTAASRSSRSRIRSSSLLSKFRGRS